MVNHDHSHNQNQSQSQSKAISGGHWSDDYLAIAYVDGGRCAATGLDCWGLVRDVLHQHFQQPLLNDFGNIHADDKPNMTNAYHQTKSSFVECQAKPGAIIAGFKGALLIHVGVVIETNGLHVLHTSSRHGMSKCPVRRFNRLFSQVKYYAYKTK
jgi:cell wall-associated NlpC family hydrolase